MTRAAPALRLFGDPALRTPAEPVVNFDRALARLVARMIDTMDAADGVGLAANQIGVGLRVFVYDLRDGRSGQVVNPILRIYRDGIDEDIEGCLSLPGQHYPTPRPAGASVTGFDVKGRPIEVGGDGLLARCLQHEVDHLDGFFYIDRLSRHARRGALDDYYAGTP